MSNVKLQKRRLSFDYDGCLDIPKVQEFARKVVDLGFEVWITTSRVSGDDAPNDTWNDDLFLVADSLDIPKERIIFAGIEPKYKTMLRRGINFLFHLDDSWEDCREINENTKTNAITNFGNKNWTDDCMAIISPYT